MPARGRLIMLPLRTHAQFPNVPDEVITLPEIPLPGDESTSSSQPGAGGGTPQPLPAPADLFGKYGSAPVVDIIGTLPRNMGNVPSPATAEKTSITFHWEGPSIPNYVPDWQMPDVIRGIALFHIGKDWGGGFGGSGIMYHEVISPDGTVFLTRDYQDHLWHCGNPEGNLHSRAILVYCAKDRPATEVQLFRVTQRIIDFGVPKHVHSEWSATDCPGDQLRNYLSAIR